MSGQEIPLENEEAVINLLSQANSGKKLILIKYGVINVSSIDSITPHKEKMEEVRNALLLGQSREKAELESLGPSPFAKLLVDGMKMLSDYGRTIAQEESAREERKHEIHE